MLIRIPILLIMTWSHQPQYFVPAIILALTLVFLIRKILRRPAPRHDVCEILRRFPHLGDNILRRLDYQTLIHCTKVNRSFKEFMKIETLSSRKIIKHYTDCSDELMFEVIEETGSAFILSSILKEIFKKFPKRTRQGNRNFRLYFTSPLHLAAENGHPAVCKLIMEKTIDKNPLIPLYTGDNTPLHLAAKNGNFLCCKEIMNNTHEKNPTNSRLLTPLHMAAKNGHLQVCKLIVKTIQNKHPKTQNDEKTPFHLAAEEGHVEVCAMFLGLPGFQNYKDENGDTPFHFAAKKGHIKVCKLMLEKLEFTEPRNGFLETPLHFAAAFNFLEIFRILFEENEARCQSKDQSGFTPTERAIQRNNFEIVRYIQDRKMMNENKFNSFW